MIISLSFFLTNRAQWQLQYMMYNHITIIRMDVEIRDFLSTFSSPIGTFFYEQLHFFKVITEAIWNNYTQQSHDSAFDPRKTTERLFKLISANISLITEQILLSILPMWLAMMHLHYFIRQRKERLCVKFVHLMKSDLRFPLTLAYNEQTVFCSPRDTPLQFVSKILNIFWHVLNSQKGGSLFTHRHYHLANFIASSLNVRSVLCLYNFSTAKWQTCLREGNLNLFFAVMPTNHLSRLFY